MFLGLMEKRILQDFWASDFTELPISGFTVPLILLYHEFELIEKAVKTIRS